MGEETSKRMMAAESVDEGVTYVACQAVKNPSGIGELIPDFYPLNIVSLKDGTLLNEKGQRSNDNGRSWSAKKPLFEFECEEDKIGLMGILRMPNDELGLYYTTNCTWETCFGHDSSNYAFRWSDDEGKNWSEPVVMTVPGIVMGQGGSHFVLKNGRICVVTYSQFLAPMELWGGSNGTYQGYPVQTEREGHFGEMEVTRVYYSDDCGRKWSANKGWIMGWREGPEKWTDSFVEATGCQLRDGRVFMLGRSLIGRMLISESLDNGNIFGYAYPSPLMTSDSPGRLIQDPENGNLIFIWNQISREENRRGFRRSRLSSAISKDDGKTWENFKNLYAINCLAEDSYIPPDPVMTPVWADEEVGELPLDFEMWHYPTASIVGRELFLGMCHNTFELKSEGNGKKVHWNSDVRTNIIPLNWFYTKER